MRRSASVGWVRGGQEGRGERTRVLSELTHFGPKSEAEMGAHGQDRTAVCLRRATELRFSHFPVRADTFGRGVVEWVGPLEMP
jgi:hypothetical protein